MMGQHPSHHRNPGLEWFRKQPKADLHNHCLLGGDRRTIERFTGRRLAPFRFSGKGIQSLNQWIGNEVREVYQLPGGVEKGIEAAFLQAVRDGVVRLEMSIDVLIPAMFPVTPKKIVQTLSHFHRTLAPHIDFRPELGMARSVDPGHLMKSIEPFLATGYFQSIDLYDDEFAQPAGAFREIYRRAKQLGMRCKAHAGEFGSADSVKETVETLELDAVQHGISAATSPAVMRWLADQQIPLNVCPASNIRLRRARSYSTHPVRILFDHGVRVTINTDDALIFRTGVSEQMNRLFVSGAFTLAELEIIRLNGLA